MRVLITAGTSFTVMHVGINQEYIIAMENHCMIKPNIHGTSTNWVLESDFYRLYDAAVRYLDCEDMGSKSTCDKELLKVISELRLNV